VLAASDDEVTEEGAVHVVRMQLWALGLHASRALAGGVGCSMDDVVTMGVKRNAHFNSASRRDNGDAVASSIWLVG